MLVIVQLAVSPHMLYTYVYSRRPRGWGTCRVRFLPSDTQRSAEKRTTPKGKDSLRSWDPPAPSLPIPLKILGTCTREGSLHPFVKFQSHIPPKSFRRLLAFRPHYGAGSSGNLKRDNGPGRSTSTPLSSLLPTIFLKETPLLP